MNKGDGLHDHPPFLYMSLHWHFEKRLNGYFELASGTEYQRSVEEEEEREKLRLFARKDRERMMRGIYILDGKYTPVQRCVLKILYGPRWLYRD